MAHRLLRIMAKLRSVIQGRPTFHNPLSYERHGIALTSGVSVGDFEHGKCLHTRAIAVLAVPMAEFKVQIRAIDAKLSRQQLLSVLQAQGVIGDDESVDILSAPHDSSTVAVFSMSVEQREGYVAAYDRSNRHLVAIEPDCHALWRYARHQRLEQHGWLMTTSHQSTLFWPAEWPWGYHAEAFDNASIHDGTKANDVLHTVIRRACLMTGNNEPCQCTLNVVGDKAIGQRWKGWLSGIDSQLINGVNPIVLGAAMKCRQRWA